MKKDYREFVRRTLKVLESYDNNLQDGEQSYDRTLFINACLGLLILPQQELYDNLPTDISASEWGIPTENIIMKNKKVDVKEITRHFRNAITHNRIDFDCNGGPTKPIDEITFTDGSKEYVENFKVTLDFNTFRNFIMEFARYILK